jgi:hypothetical protein
MGRLLPLSLDSSHGDPGEVVGDVSTWWQTQAGMEPEAVAYAEAVRALDQQRVELGAVRTRVATIFGTAGIVASFFSGLIVRETRTLGGLGIGAVAAFCVVGLAAILILWPWKWWAWTPPSDDLVQHYIDGQRVTAEVMERDLALHLADNWRKNNEKLNRMQLAVMVALVGLGAEVVLWVLAL